MVRENIEEGDDEVRYKEFVVAYSRLRGSDRADLIVEMLDLAYGSGSPMALALANSTD